MKRYTPNNALQYEQRQRKQAAMWQQYESLQRQYYVENGKQTLTAAQKGILNMYADVINKQNGS